MTATPTNIRLATKLAGQAPGWTVEADAIVVADLGNRCGRRSEVSQADPGGGRVPAPSLQLDAPTPEDWWAGS
ncbi:MAG: hypothetical protein J0I40_04765 [Cellulomonas sp.]|nr:hypothetical protein [Cellulomonas sp.]